MKVLKNKKILPIIYIMLSIIFVIPSIIYFFQNKTVYEFNMWFKFFLNDTSKELQTVSYIAILIAIIFCYVMIIKNRNKIFKNIKSVLKYVAIIGFIYVLAIPFTSSDVFYYMGVGRIDSNYNQNPYYSTIKQYVDENQENLNELENDTVLMEGYLNNWADTTVVYGPVWQLVCKGVALLSFGNVDFGLLIFKLLALGIHLLNCWLIYKLTGKKIFAIIYGLNPFILLEGIMCVHNDLFVVMFTLFSLYFMKKKKLWLSMIFLALATAIKYFSILLLPFIIIYYFRKERVSVRILNCIKYGLIFLVALVLPYLLYVQDLSILAGMATQQGKIANSIYLLILEYFPTIPIGILSALLLGVFVIVYFFTCLIILFKKDLKFKELIKKYTVFLLVFIFGLITQFQPWYLMWVISIFMWQKPNTLRILIMMGIMAEFANLVFILNKEHYIYGISFIFILYLGILIYSLIIEKQSSKRKIKCFEKNLLK